MAIDNNITAYPLCWTNNVNRSKDLFRRTHPSFKTTIAKARDNLISEIKRLGGSDLIISTNLQLRKDGLLCAKNYYIADPGVAIYFKYKGKQMCFACDKWAVPEHNLQAIAKTIEALRGIERWGSGDMLEAAFTGFTALPNPAIPKTWRDILGVSTNACFADVEIAYKQLRSIHHPDKGGSAEMFNAIQRAWEQAQLYFKK